MHENVKKSFDFLPISTDCYKEQETPTLMMLILQFSYTISNQLGINSRVENLMLKNSTFKIKLTWKMIKLKITYVWWFRIRDLTKVSYVKSTNLHASMKIYVDVFFIAILNCQLFFVSDVLSKMKFIFLHCLFWFFWEWKRWYWVGDGVEVISLERL